MCGADVKKLHCTAHAPLKCHHVPGPKINRRVWGARLEGGVVLTNCSAMRGKEPIVVILYVVDPGLHKSEGEIWVWEEPVS